MSNNNKWLTTVEYLAILASVAGTFASEVSRQIVFTSAPLSLALFLSLVNRKRSDQQIEEKVDSDVGQLRHDFYELDRNVWRDIESIRQQLLSLPSPPEAFDLNHVQGAIASVQAEIENRLAPLESLNLNPAREDVVQLRTEIADLQTSLDTIASQALPDLIAFQTQIEQFKHQFETSSQVLNAELLEQRFEELRTAITRLEQKTEAPTAGGELTLLFSEMRSLYQRQDTLEQQVIHAVRTEMQSHLSLLTEVGFNSIQTGISQLRTEVAQLQTNLDNQAHQASVDIAPLQNQINDINQHLAQIPPPFNPGQLEQQIEELKLLITRMEQEAEHSPFKQDLMVFFSAMRNLYQQQNGLK